MTKRTSEEKSSSVKCQICGKTFKNYRALRTHIKSHDLSSKEYYDKHLKEENEGICLMYGKIESCKKYTKYINISRGYHKFCSYRCSNNSDLVKSKKIESCKNHFGTNFPKQSSLIKEKSKITCKNHFGVEWPQQSSLIREKTKITCKNHFGVENVMQNDTIKKNLGQIFVEKFLPSFFEKLQSRNLELVDSEYINAHYQHFWKCLKCDTIFKQRWNDIQQGYKCPTCYPRNQGYSQAEIEIGEWIESLDFEIVRNNRKIIHKELDIYIPELKIAIEYNGLYWHQESLGVSKDYHLRKTKLCTEKGIQLIHIFEDEWEEYKEDMKNLLYKILVENYDLLDNKCESIVINRRFSKNPEYYEKLGYIVEMLGPRLYPNDSRFKVWDVGYLEIKELRRTPLS